MSIFSITLKNIGSDVVCDRPFRPNKLNPHMTPGPGVEPGPHWWEASALTTATTSLLPCNKHTLSSSFIDSFSFAMKRCNTWQGFGAFFVQSCDRFLFPFSLFFLFSHFLPFFLDFFLIVAKFLIKQLFYSGLLDIE